MRFLFFSCFLRDRKHVNLFRFSSKKYFIIEMNNRPDYNKK